MNIFLLLQEHHVFIMAPTHDHHDQFIHNSTFLCNKRWDKKITGLFHFFIKSVFGMNRSGLLDSHFLTSSWVDVLHTYIKVYYTHTLPHHAHHLSSRLSNRRISSWIESTRRSRWTNILREQWYNGSDMTTTWQDGNPVSKVTRCQYSRLSQLTPWLND